MAPQVRRRIRNVCLALLCAGFLGINGIAWMQARAMTHFQAGGARTHVPEHLSTYEKWKTVFCGVKLPRPKSSQTTGDLRRITIGKNEFVAASFAGAKSKSPRGIVLLFHAYAASRDMLVDQARAFAGMNYDTLSIDFRGSGDSSGNDTTVGFREADDVAATFDDARKLTDRPVILYGSSMGAAAIFRAIAIKHVQPAAIIVESPYNSLIETVENRFHAMGLPSFPGAHLLVFWGGIQHGFNGFALNPVEYAKLVRCPVLFMRGRQDPRVTAAQATEIFTNLPGKKELVEFPDTTHQILIHAQPELWSTRVAAFLAGVTAQ